MFLSVIPRAVVVAPPTDESRAGEAPDNRNCLVYPLPRAAGLPSGRVAVLLVSTPTLLECPHILVLQFPSPRLSGLAQVRIPPRDILQHMKLFKGQIY